MINMSTALLWHWKIVMACFLAGGLVAGLTLGIPLLSDKSSEVLAAELASRSPEVQNALGSGVVQVLETQVAGDGALVICAGESGEFVTVQVDLEEKKIVKVTPNVSPSNNEMPDLEGGTLETTTDKFSYASGEEVTIEITNISPETISGGGVYYYVHDLEGNWVAGNGLFLAFELQPGEGLPSLTWNQVDKDGKQVESGTYVIQGKAGDYSDATLVYVG